ncbi:MAG: hypothetical protein ABMA64_27240 [Myxococcota bacterium]
MIEAARVAVRTELLTVLRTRELYLLVALPAAVGMPLLVTAVVLVMSWFGRPVVAVPLGAPLEPMYGFELARVADPAAALAEGSADLAVTRLEVAALEVPRDTWSPVPRATPPWWTVDLAWADPGSGPRLTQLVERGARDALATEIRDRGGSVGATRDVARRSREEAAEVSEPPIDLARVLLAVLVVLGNYGGCLLVPRRTFSERESGVLEAFAAARTPVMVHLCARIGVSVAVTCAVLALPVFAVGLLPGVSAGLRVLDGVEVVAIVGAMTVGFVGAGLVAGSSRSAMSLASNLYLVMFLSFAAGFLWVVPWVPVLGTPSGATGQVARVVSTLVVGLVALAGLARLARGDHLLPPGAGAE